MNNVAHTRSDVSVVLFFFSVLAVVGVIGAGFIVNDYGRARASAAWPVYEGIVLSSDVGDELRYIYSVHGRSYESVRMRFFSSAPFQSAQSYGPGEVVRVYVDPDDSSFSVLTPGGAGALFALLSFVLGSFVFLGVGGVVRTLTAETPNADAIHKGAQRA